MEIDAWFTHLHNLISLNVYLSNQRTVDLGNLDACFEGRKCQAQGCQS